VTTQPARIRDSSTPLSPDEHTSKILFTPRYQDDRRLFCDRRRLIYGELNLTNHPSTEGLYTTASLLASCSRCVFFLRPALLKENAFACGSLARGRPIRSIRASTRLDSPP
jgi:hypothetical protein